MSAVAGSIDKERQLAVAHRLVAVGRSFSAFEFKGEQYLPKVVDKTMREAERAFAADDYDRAEHLAQVVAFLVYREAPKFAADPQAWIENKAVAR